MCFTSAGRRQSNPQTNIETIQAQRTSRKLIETSRPTRSGTTSKATSLPHGSQLPKPKHPHCQSNQAPHHQTITPHHLNPITTSTQIATASTLNANPSHPSDPARPRQRPLQTHKIPHRNLRSPRPTPEPRTRSTGAHRYILRAEGTRQYSCWVCRGQLGPLGCGDGVCGGGLSKGIGGCF